MKVQRMRQLKCYSCKVLPRLGEVAIGLCHPATMWEQVHTLATIIVENSINLLKWAPCNITAALTTITAPWVLRRQMQGQLATSLRSLTCEYTMNHLVSLDPTIIPKLPQPRPNMRQPNKDMQLCEIISSAQAWLTKVKDLWDHLTHLIGKNKWPGTPVDQTWGTFRTSLIRAIPSISNPIVVSYLKAINLRKENSL